MYKLFIFEEGIEIGAETVTEQDLSSLRDYFHRQGYVTEVELLS